MFEDKIRHDLASILVEYQNHHGISKSDLWKRFSGLSNIHIFRQYSIFVAVYKYTYLGSSAMSVGSI